MNPDNIKGPSTQWFEVRWKILTSQDDESQVLCACIIQSIYRLGFDTNWSVSASSECIFWFYATLSLLLRSYQGSNLESFSS